MKNSCKVYFCLCAWFLLIVAFSACKQSAGNYPGGYVDRIVEACSDSENRFPTDKIDVEFQGFTLPNAEKNFFQHHVRFKNVSGQDLKIQILGFYDSALDKYIVAREGMLQPDALKSPVVIANEAGWVFYNTLTPLREWESYSELERAEIIDLASKLYFEIILETDVYYCILDFNNQEVITVLQ